MKPFKKLLVAILAVPILLLIVSLFLPSDYRVSRSLEIKARPDAIFTNLNILKRWPEWTAWTVARYPDMQLTFEGPESGVGATYHWDGKSSGQGTLKLTAADPAKGVSYELAFEHGKMVSHGAVTLEPAGDAIRVTWSNEGDLGKNPVARYFGLFMDRMMGPDLMQGLQNLKQRAEANAN